MLPKIQKVAVLLAACNGIRWIEHQLFSIQQQEAVDVTVYISVDPSVDGTESWCRQIAARSSNIIVLAPSGNFGGASANFFRLFRDVNLDPFDFVALADQDDVWHVDKLRRALNVLNAHGADGYSSNVDAFWPTGRRALVNKAQAQVKWDFLFEAAGPGCTYVLSKKLALALKASMLINRRPLQGVTLHDWYCYAFARSAGYRWYIDPVPSMHYRQHERNQMGVNKGFRMLLKRYQAVRNGWWFGQVQLIAQLVDHRADPFVNACKHLHPRRLLLLSFSAWRCRRRLRDKLLFFFACWVTALVGKKG